MKATRISGHVIWQGNTGTGTSGYRDYGRDHLVCATGKPDIPGSAILRFEGSGSLESGRPAGRLARPACHKLWYLQFLRGVPA